jgi:hypothetical protein
MSKTTRFRLISQDIDEKIVAESSPPVFDFWIQLSPESRRSFSELFYRKIFLWLFHVREFIWHQNYQQKKVDGGREKDTKKHVEMWLP